VEVDIASMEPCDLLITSTTKGFTQKLFDPTKAYGVILGKYLGNLKSKDKPKC
jgi:hypothetical protein